MAVQDYLRILRERWMIAVATIVVGIIAAGIAWSTQPVEYTARLTMYVSAQSADSPNAAYQGSLLSQQRVSSYVRLVDSPRVTGEVIDRLRLPVTVESLGSRISASSALDSVLIDVAAVAATPQEATRIADTVGAVFAGLVDEIERPATPGAAPPVIVRVVQPAIPPSAPSSPGLSTTLLVGALLGVLAGIGLAVLRHSTDTSVRTLDQLRDITGAPNLGTLAFDPSVPKRPLTVQGDPHSPRAEAFRQLRTNLQFIGVDQPRKVVVVTSALPEEGKTTSLCNLAIAIAATGLRVLVVEADLRRPRAAGLLGLDDAVGLTSVLAGRADADQAIQPWAGGRFDLLASGPLPPNPSELLGSRQMVTLIEQMRARYDYVLLDCPPLLPVTDAAAVASATDGAILVCRFKKTTRAQLGRAVDTLAAVSTPLLGTIFTMVRAQDTASGYRHYEPYTRTAPVAPERVPTP
jgi:capsular exopolysaccharide synthesis family protein